MGLDLENRNVKIVVVSLCALVSVVCFGGFLWARLQSKEAWNALEAQSDQAFEMSEQHIQNIRTIERSARTAPQHIESLEGFLIDGVFLGLNLEVAWTIMRPKLTEVAETEHLLTENPDGTYTVKFLMETVDAHYSILTADSEMALTGMHFSPQFMREVYDFDYDSPADYVTKFRAMHNLPPFTFTQVTEDNPWYEPGAEARGVTPTTQVSLWTYTDHVGRTLQIRSTDGRIRRLSLFTGAMPPSADFANQTDLFG